MTKPAELREQTDEQLDLLLKETQQNLFRLRLQSETERLEAPSEIIKAKREIARIKTILRLREIERERSAATALTALKHAIVGTTAASEPIADAAMDPDQGTRDEPADPHARPPPARRRKTEIGVVTSDKMNKTRRVEVETLVPAPEVRQAAEAPDRLPRARRGRTSRTSGDMVEIMETRPLSKLKRWRIVRIVRPGAQQALAGEGEAATQVQAES